MRFFGLCRTFWIIAHVFSFNGLFSQTQIGQTVYGEEPNQGFGNEVEISSNGEYFVTGLPDAPDIHTSKGEVRVYRLINNLWIRVGKVLSGDTLSHFGYSVSISEDGSCIAVGARGFGSKIRGFVEIYCFDGNEWNRKGISIKPNDEHQKYFGTAVSLSDNGNRVLISSYNSFNGLLDFIYQVFEWNGNQWTQLGDDIYENNPYRLTPTNYHLSGDGKRLIIGGLNSKGTFFKVFEWDGNQWTQLGKTKHGETLLTTLGHAAELSYDGNMYVVSAPRSVISNLGPGIIRVYAWNGVDWKQMGEDIMGDSDGIIFGEYCSISNDGKIISANLQLQDSTNKNHHGAVLSFRWNGDQWIRLGDRIELREESNGGFFGEVSLSGDGSKLAISNFRAGADSKNYGLVKVYQSAVVNSEHKSDPKISLFPNPTTGKIYLEYESEVDYNVTNLLGSVLNISRTQNGEIDISNLPNGVYIIQLDDGKRRHSSKIIKAAL